MIENRETAAHTTTTSKIRSVKSEEEMHNRPVKELERVTVRESERKKNEKKDREGRRIPTEGDHLKMKKKERDRMATFVLVSS